MSLEGDAGDNYLSTDGTVAKKEGSGKVAVAVRSNEEVLASLTGIERLGKVARSGTLGSIYNTTLVVEVIVLAVSTVINTDYFAVLVENEGLTPTVSPVECALVIGSVNDEEILTKNGEILVDSDLVIEKSVTVCANLNLNGTGVNLNGSGNGSGVHTVGSLKSNGILTGLVNIKAAIVLNSNGNGNVIGRIKGTVIIGSSYTCKNTGLENELGGTCNDGGIVTGNNGSLVYVRSKNLLCVSPKKTNNVAIGPDYVVVHVTTAVGVNGGAAIAVLNNDCIAACGNNHILSELISLNCCGRCCTIGVVLIHESGVSAVTTLDYNTVSSNDTCNAVAAADAESDIGGGIVVEYAAYSVVVCLAAVELNILCVLKVKESSLPLSLAKAVSLNLESKSRESLLNGYLTGSGCLYTELVHCKVGDGVNALNVSIEVVVVLNEKLGSLVALVGNSYAEHKVDFLTCVDLELLGNYGDNRSGSYNVTLALFSANGLGAVCISTLATLGTSALALVSRSNFVTLALFSASRLGAISIGTLATLCTNTLALVSGSLVGSLMTLALSSASCISAFSVKAMATLRTYALTNVRLYVRCRGVNEVLNCVASCEAKHCNKNQRDNCQNS